jgi:hypothetical protein
MAPNRVHQPYVTSLAVNLNHKSDNTTKVRFPTAISIYFGIDRQYSICYEFERFI